MEALRRSVESTRKGGARKKDVDLSELSKADLDRRARELGIAGRSKMKRADLEEAVREAS
jgi:DNA end-binding protein Ku